MKYSLAIASLLGLAAQVSAQGACLSTAAAVPTCATDCISSAASKAGCSQLDFQCQCSSSESMAIQGYAQACVLSKCGADSALKVINSASDVCKCASAHATGRFAPKSTAAKTTKAAGGGGGSVNTAAIQSECVTVALKVPSCATGCISSAAAKVDCGMLDFACQCSSSQSAAIQSAAQGCVLSKCGAKSALQVVNSASAVCDCAQSAGGAGGSGGGAATTGGAAAVSAVCSSVAAKVPKCATSCISSAAKKVSCGEFDFACQCSSSQSAAIMSAAQNCVLKECGANTGLSVINSASAVCDCASSAGAGSPATASASVTGGASGSAGASTTGAAASSTGGAVMVVGSVGGFMGALLAVIAAL